MLMGATLILVFINHLEQKGKKLSMIAMTDMEYWSHFWINFEGWSIKILFIKDCFIYFMLIYSSSKHILEPEKEFRDWIDIQCIIYSFMICTTNELLAKITNNTVVENIGELSYFTTVRQL